MECTFDVLWMLQIFILFSCFPFQTVGSAYFIHIASQEIVALVEVFNSMMTMRSSRSAQTTTTAASLVQEDVVVNQSRLRKVKGVAEEADLGEVCAFEMPVMA